MAWYDPLNLFGSSEPAPSTENNAPAGGFAGMSPDQRTILGLAALSDAFATLGGRQGTSLQQIAPLAEQIGWSSYVNQLASGARPRQPAQEPTPPQAAAQPIVQPTERAGPIGFGGAAIGRALDRLAAAEAPNPTAVNRFGYAGQFQLGAPLASSAGVYRPAEGEINERGQWSGQWGGTFNIPGFENVRTLQDFLQNPQAQRRAAELSMNYQAGRLQQMGLLENVGQEINGVRITPEALLQGAWLGGPGGVERFVRGGGQDRTDAFGTPVSQWMRLGQNEQAGGQQAPAVGQVAPMPTGPSQAQPAPLTPAQTTLMRPGAAGGVQITPEIAETLRRLGPNAGRQFLTQLQLRAMQQETRVLQPSEAQALLGEAYDPDRRYQITAQGGVQPIQGTREPEGGSSQQRRDLENSLRTEFMTKHQPVKDYYSMLPQIREVRAAANRENPSRLNDINLVFAFAKMLDPTSVVREGEQIQILRSQGLDGVVIGAIQRLNGGSGLLPETRQQIIREANSRFSNTQNIYEEFAEQYRGLARDYGVNPERVVRQIGASTVAETASGSGNLSQARQVEVIAGLFQRINLPPGNPQRLTTEQAIAGATAAGIPNAAALFGAR